ncbi:phage tail protein [Bacillus subtilis]|uniref:phage tail protein n=1 Tax=Bacillus subtilis TaxID=1423 RepID=UPI00214A2F5C|nr:phage tail protein [Bacillus subtilis]MCR1994592.1 phage tail protein [Bacillus subtilis]
MPYVIDLTGEEYPSMATITNDSEVNGNQILSATIEYNAVNKAFIHNIGELWRIIDHDDVEHVIKYYRRHGVGDKMAVDIKGVPVFFDKLDNDRIYERIDKHMTANEAFTRIFENTGFTFVLTDSFAAVDWEGFGDGETKLESFRRAIERYSCEFEISGNTVYLRKRIGRDTSIMYRHKLNASNIVQEIDANEMWTFARGYGNYGDGAGGEDWRNAKLIREYTSPLASILGIRHAPPIKNGNIKDRAFMDAQLKTLVDESLKISVSATIHDLRKQGYPYAQSQLGDRVFLIDERIGLNEEVRVVAQSVIRDWKGDVIDIKITFGSPGITKRHQSNLQTAIKNITDLIEGRITLPFSAVDNAVAEATKALTRMQSQLQIAENGSLLAVSRDNPNEMVIFNAAGIGVSSDGGNTFPNAITGKGVVAEAIYGNYIFGVNIASANGDGWFHVSGARAEFHSNSNGRYVYLSPNGLFGYNANGNVRFQADQTLVTSSAFGTSVENVYLAAYGEARVVNYDDIPGDGQVGSYRYLPIRASNLFADSLDVNTGTNLYLRAYSNGEVRITNTGSTSSYRPLRASNLYAASIDTNTGGSVYIRPSSNGSAHVTVTGTTNNYRPIYASEFRNGSSVIYKTNIRNLSVEALPIINNLEIKEFILQGDVDNGVYDNWQVGLISELSPEASSPDGKSINLYKLVSYATKAIQELSAENERLKKEIDDIYLILGGE